MRNLCIILLPGVLVAAMVAIVAAMEFAVVLEGFSKLK